MIRKNLLLCKLIRIKTSSKSLFDSYMEQFQPELETCPVCGGTSNCRIHDYYASHHLLSFRQEAEQYICIMRYSVTAVSTHMPSFRISLSLIPATACSSSSLSWVMPGFIRLNSSVSTLMSQKSSSING